MLKGSIINRIKGNTRLKNLLALEFNISQRQVENWIKFNSRMLAHSDALKIIATELKMDVRELKIEKVTA